jgi:tetratricopeptide (TPR) repeat protein
MHKYIIIAIFFIPVLLKAQERVTFPEADSISLQCYYSGDWDKLIESGQEAIRQNIDFKRLRQRMAYAYFAKGNYYASQKEYEKALEFDKYDTDTQLYLYYCGLNTGNEAAARYYAARLPQDLQNTLKVSSFKPFSALDFEYSYGINKLTRRSNPSYIRAGIATELGYRLSLYQSLSKYTQTIEKVSSVIQPEYFALLNYTITPYLYTGLAYHFVNTSVDGTKYPYNLLLISLSSKVNRFSFGLNGSIFTNNSGKSVKQIGLKGGFILPVKSNIYFNSILSRVLESGNNRTVFSQTAGAQLFRNLWAEGNVTLGNLGDYNDNNGLYIYNSLDPVTFRTGITLYRPIGKKIILEGNYIFNKKLIESSNKYYPQQSFTGGIIWKF